MENGRAETRQKALIWRGRQGKKPGFTGQKRGGRAKDLRGRVVAGQPVVISGLPAALW